MSTFTITDSPVWGRWYGLTFDGPKITGTARITSHIDDGKHVVLIDLSPHLNDENGHTLYRTADPDADEFQTGSAVVRNPVRVNGVAYSGTVYVERPLDSDMWRSDTSYLGRVGGVSIYGAVTDAARRAIFNAGREVAAAFATPERLWNDREAAARSVVDRARKALDEAQAAYTAAAEALVEIQTRRVSASR